VNGIVNCGGTSYQSGIEYDSFDDLTVNVGAPAGQNGTVTVDDTIVANDMWHASDEEEWLLVGGNVTIRAAGSGESIEVYTSTSHIKAVSNADIVNGAVIATFGEGAFGIKSLASALTAAYASADGKSVATSRASASVDNSGLIVTSGDYARGIFARAQALESYQGGYAATMTTLSQVNNTGDIITVGDGSDAIYAASFISSYGGHFYQGLYNHTATVPGSADEATLAVSNAGRLRTQGINASGINAVIDALGYSDKVLAMETVTNNGAIDTTGDYAAGIKARLLVEGNGLDSTMVTAQIDVTNSGAITTRGEYAGDIVVTSNAMAWDRGASSVASSTTVDNSGAIATSGDYSEGIQVQTFSANQNPDTTAISATGIVTNTGKISTAGYGATAIDVTANAQGSGNELDAIIDAYNTGAITTSDTKARGINLVASTTDGSGTAVQTTSIAANNSGAITTSRDAAGAIMANARSNGVDGSAGAAITIDNSGDLTTEGRSASGIYTMAIAMSSGSDGSSLQAQSSVTNSASISTLGDFSYGISEIVAVGTDQTGLVTALQASIAADNSGTIDTSGNHAHGITVLAVTGGDIGSQTVTATADNSGIIMTSGDNARGIWAVAYAGDNSVAMYSKTTVNNSGLIETAGAGSNAILTNAGAYGAGNDSAHLSSSNRVTNAGQIITSGNGSGAIRANAALYDGRYSTVAGKKDTGTVSVTVDNAGTLTTTGGYAPGIMTTATAKSYYGDSVILDTATSISNSGTISTSGASASGIGASTLINPNNVHPTINSGTNIANSGTILVSGDGADGISATVSLKGVPLAASSSIDPALSVIASILPIEPDDPGSGYDVSTPVVSADVSNSGSIVVTGRYGAGVVATVLTSGTLGSACNAGIYDCDMAAYISSTTHVENSGQILASGFGGIGVVARADTVMIDNLAHGTISGGTGSSAAGIVAAGSDVIVTNAGTITSANDHALMLIGTDTVSLTNYAGGKIVGYVTATSDDTTFENDGTWTARGGDSDFTPTAGGSSVVVNRGTVLVVGNQAFKGLSEFDNAGVLSLSWANASGTRPAFEKLEVTGDFVGLAGSRLEVGSNMTTMADLLKIDGAVSGSTTVVVDEEGPPGLTTGNGIAVIDVSSGTTSAGNFKLAGNSTAGTLVDGAYEYALGLVPGSAGHGTWYLSSRIYPGDYQFGQIGSSALLLSQLANNWFGDALLNWGKSDTHQASAAVPGHPAGNDSNPLPAERSVADGLGIWGEWDGASIAVSPSGPAFGDYRLHASLGHMGTDALLEGNYGTLIVGMEASPINANASFQNFASTSMKMTGYAWAGFGAWIDGSWRAGLQFGQERLRTHVEDDYIGTDAKLTLSAFSIQGVATYEGWLDDDTWFEPSAALGYTSVDGGSFVDGTGATVSFGSTQSVLAELRARIGRTYDIGYALLKPHADLGFNYEFDGSTAVSIGSFTASSGLQGLTAQGGGGIDLEIGDNLSLFADALYADGAKQSGWQGHVGLRLIR